MLPSHLKNPPDKVLTRARFGCSRYADDIGFHWRWTSSVLLLELITWLWRCSLCLLFVQQTQIPDYAELIVKFLEALIDSYLPAADEERGEEQLRTPTSPYPPTSQSQLSITANLNLSNSMTSLATSQHSPGVHLSLQQKAYSHSNSLY